MIFVMIYTLSTGDDSVGEDFEGFKPCEHHAMAHFFPTLHQYTNMVRIEQKVKIVWGTYNE